MDVRMSVVPGYYFNDIRPGRNLSLKGGIINKIFGIISNAANNQTCFHFFTSFHCGLETPPSISAIIK